MHWLNSPYPTDADPTAPGVARGTCSITSGKPADVEAQTPGATVTYSNIKTGPFGSTYSGTLQPGGSPGTGGSSSSSSAGSSSSSTRVSSSSSTTRATTTTVRTSTTTTSSRATTTTTTAAGLAQKYAQCGVSVPLHRYEFCLQPHILTYIAGNRLHWPDRLRQRLHLQEDQRVLLAVLVDVHDKTDSARL